MNQNAIDRIILAGQAWAHRMTATIGTLTGLTASGEPNKGDNDAMSEPDWIRRDIELAMTGTIAGSRDELTTHVLRLQGERAERRRQLDEARHLIEIMAALDPISPEARAISGLPGWTSNSRLAAKARTWLASADEVSG